MTYRIDTVQTADGVTVYHIYKLMKPEPTVGELLWKYLLPGRAREKPAVWKPLCWAPLGMGDLATPNQYRTREDALAKIAKLKFRDEHGEEKTISSEEIP